MKVFVSFSYQCLWKKHESFSFNLLVNSRTNFCLCKATSVEEGKIEFKTCEYRTSYLPTKTYLLWYHCTFTDVVWLWPYAFQEWNIYIILYWKFVMYKGKNNQSRSRKTSEFKSREHGTSASLKTNLLWNHSTIIDLVWLWQYICLSRVQDILHHWQNSAITCIILMVG